MAFVGIIISGVLPLFLNLVTVNKSSQYQSLAYKMADSKIEELRAGNFDDVSSSTYTISELPGGQGNLSVSTNVDGAVQNDIKKVDLTVSWSFKRQQSIRIVTYLARDGIKK